MTRTVVNIIESRGMAQAGTWLGRTPRNNDERRCRLPLYVATLLAACFILGAASQGNCEDADLAKFFIDRKVQGTIVISSLDGSQTYLHNETRAGTPFVPASTFKILNTLIALDEHAIADEKEIMKWGGADEGVAEWNRDQTIETAFKSSCIWFYQNLARQVGAGKYEQHLKKAAYGNAKAGPELTTFWLEGDLKISAIEQVEFLKRLYRHELAYRGSSYEILKRIMTLEQTPAYTVWGKTGWAPRTSPQLGWFVGYVQAKDGIWFFATNIEMDGPAQARYRQEITMQALKAKGIL